MIAQKTLLILSITSLLPSFVYCSETDTILLRLVRENDRNKALEKHPSLNKRYPWPDMHSETETSDTDSADFYNHLAAKNKIVRRQRLSENTPQNQAVHRPVVRRRNTLPQQHRRNTQTSAPQQTDPSTHNEQTVQPITQQSDQS